MIYPSGLAVCLAVVARMTGMSARDVWYRMSYARVLQYRSVWFYEQGCVCYPVIGENKITQPL